MRIAVFDLDHTLINCDSGRCFAEYLCEYDLIENPVAYRRQFSEFAEAYSRGEVDFMRFYRFALEPLTRLTIRRLDAIVAAFVDEVIESHIYGRSQALLDWHRNQGDRLVLISATLELLVQPIGQRLGFAPEDILAVQLARKNGYYTGEIVGQPSYGEGKVKRFRSWCQDQGVTGEHWHSCFYSDSIYDAPLLGTVDEPVVVNPDAALARLAQQRHWPVVAMESLSLPPPLRREGS